MLPTTHRVRLYSCNARFLTAAYTPNEFTCRRKERRQKCIDISSHGSGKTEIWSTWQTHKRPSHPPHQRHGRQWKRSPWSTNTGAYPGVGLCPAPLPSPSPWPHKIVVINTTLCVHLIVYLIYSTCFTMHHFSNIVAKKECHIVTEFITYVNVNAFFSSTN